MSIYSPLAVIQGVINHPLKALGHDEDLMDDVPLLEASCPEKLAFCFVHRNGRPQWHVRRNRQRLSLVVVVQHSRR